MVDVPKTMIHPVTGAVLRRGVRKEVVCCRGFETTIDAPGWYPEGPGEGIHTGSDNTVCDEALRTLMSRGQLPCTLEELRAAVKIGLDDLDAGRHTEASAQDIPAFTASLHCKEGFVARQRLLALSPVASDDFPPEMRRSPAYEAAQAAAGDAIPALRHYPATLVRDAGRPSPVAVIFPDFPGCSASGMDAEDAAHVGVAILSTVIEDMAEAGDPIPAPSALATMPECLVGLEGVEVVGHIMVPVDMPAGV